MRETEREGGVWVCEGDGISVCEEEREGGSGVVGT